MKKFTFITEFRDGTYISQYESDHIQNAISQWATMLDFVKSSKEKEIIKSKMNDDFYKPVRVETVENVWCVSFTVKRSFLLLNIVETV